MVKVFTLNKNNKIELTKQELQSLLDEAYWEGYRSNTSWTWTSPNWLNGHTVSWNADNNLVYTNTNGVSNLKVNSDVLTTNTASDLLINENNVEINIPS